MEEKSVTLDALFNPEFWKNERLYGGCVHFVLNNYELLVKLASHLNPRIMEFRDDSHFYLELDTPEGHDRFVIDPERISVSSRHFFVGRLGECAHPKKQGYSESVQSENMEAIWKEGIRVEDMAMYW